ncbi:hypothetical protein C5L38_21200 [Streptomyces sp. WAC00288]|uniref:hypothetical protein n=1 Tax=unclassified Streptomyces TaxID=2593676 RepID=UPI0007883D53|nr:MULTISPECIES: hypothetical protein [unclassified Streptomyces]AVH97274.1 hypothetical protein C5L38_21200 [Streptomyces sp. WAC00288]KYG55875.1 hypothetical protein AWI43_16865 [Streptomyces sp. WAC04657]
MTTTAPHPALLDHRGDLKPRIETSLDYEQARLGAAFHEAGHAVIAMSYGMHVVSSEVIAWTPDEGGFTLTGSTFLAGSGTNPWHFAAQAAAGALAKVQYLLVYGLWTPQLALGCAADHDREQAIDLLAEFGCLLDRNRVPAGGKSWGQVQGMARRRMNRLWREIRTVAHAMNENTSLSGGQIAAMTGLTNAPMPEGVA